MFFTIVAAFLCSVGAQVASQGFPPLSGFPQHRYYLGDIDLANAGYRAVIRVQLGFSPDFRAVTITTSVQYGSLNGAPNLPVSFSNNVLSVPTSDFPRIFGYSPISVPFPDYVVFTYLPHSDSFTVDLYVTVNGAGVSLAATLHSRDRSEIDLYDRDDLGKFLRPLNPSNPSNPPIFTPSRPPVIADPTPFRPYHRLYSGDISLASAGYSQSIRIELSFEDWTFQRVTVSTRVGNGLARATPPQVVRQRDNTLLLDSDALKQLLEYHPITVPDPDSITLVYVLQRDEFLFFARVSVNGRTVNLEATLTSREQEVYLTPSVSPPIVPNPDGPGVCDFQAFCGSVLPGSYCKTWQVPSVCHGTQTPCSCS